MGDRLTNYYKPSRGWDRPSAWVQHHHGMGISYKAAGSVRTTPAWNPRAGWSYPPSAYTGAEEHIDRGLLTLVASLGVEGLQAQRPSGEWFDVPLGRAPQPRPSD